MLLLVGFAFLLVVSSVPLGLRLRLRATMRILSEGSLKTALLSVDILKRSWYKSPYLKIYVGLHQSHKGLKIATISLIASSGSISL
jgi:hypothetical protein